jgi:CHAT domain-containing protein
MVHSALGNRDQALRVSEQAAVASKIYIKNFPDDFWVHSKTLSALSEGLGSAGQRAASVRVAEEAVSLYRQHKDFSSPSNLDGYRYALSSLRGSYGGSGRFADSIGVSEEIVTLIRKMQLHTSSAFSSRSLSYSLLLELSSIAEFALKTKDSTKYIKAIKEGLIIYPDLLAIASDPDELRIVKGFQLQIAVYNSLVEKNNEKSLAAFRELADRPRSSLIGSSFPVFAGASLVNMANIYMARGEYSRAFEVSGEAVQSFRSLSSSNPTYQIGLHQALSVRLASCIRLPKCNENREIVREALALESGYQLDQISQTPEGKRESFREANGNWANNVYIAALRKPEDVQLALLTRLSRQGLLLELQRRQALAARSGRHQRLNEQIQAIKLQTSNLTIPAQQRQQLLAQQERLEFELFRLLPAIRPQLVEPAQVARLLPPDGALVEFQRFYPDANIDKPIPPAHYLALVLKPEGRIGAIPLGAAALIDAAVSAALSASADPNRQVEASAKLAAVSQLVLKPLKGQLAGVHELFLSPDGELNRLPFAALPVAAAGGRTLAESVNLRLLTTGRDLVRFQQPVATGSPSTLIIDPDFNAAAISPATANRQVTGGGLEGLGPWNPLPGTAAEADLLAPLLRPRAVIRGRQATAAEALKQKAPRILHIATHGFFLEDAPVQRDRQKPGDPLQRSGLVFAGANQPASDPADDGYLTAKEVTAMNLEGTELVTLSACETGLGGVRSGEGVYGLQRALAVAGARSTLLSLWKVDDALTAIFMQEFYKRLMAGEGRADALRNTQRWFRTNPSSTLRDVRVWGAFQLSGDWRPIQRW